MILGSETSRHATKLSQSHDSLWHIMYITSSLAEERGPRPPLAPLPSVPEDKYLLLIRGKSRWSTREKSSQFKLLDENTIKGKDIEALGGHGVPMTSMRTRAKKARKKCWKLWLEVEAQKIVFASWRLKMLRRHSFWAVEIF
jgi:hypothetical protein